MKLETYTAIKLPNVSARLMRSAITMADLDWKPILASAGVPSEAIDDPRGLITGAQELALQSAFVAATGPWDGQWLRLGLQYPVMGFGPLGLTVLASGTFGSGLRSITSFLALTYSLMEYRTIEENGEVIGLEADDSKVSEDCREFCQHRGIGAITRVINDMAPSLSAILRIETVLDERRGMANAAELLGAPVTFNAPVTRWIFRPGVSQSPLPMANPLLEQTYAELCTQLIEEAQVSDETVNQLYNLLVRSARTYPSAPEASKLLGLSERTLYRRLAGQSLTFGQVLARVQEQRATYLLEQTGLSIERIADNLGFAETASFSRAFKRWTGLSPLSFRRKPRQATRPEPGQLTPIALRKVRS